MNTPNYHSRAVPAAALALLLPLASLHAAPQGKPNFTPVLTHQGLFRTLNGDLAAEGRNWQARFDRDGACLETLDPADAKQAVSVALRLVDYGRSGFVQQASTAAPSQRGEAMLRYRHLGIVERYKVDSGGFEQSFVLQQRPAGSGDYVLGIAASGDGLQLPECTAAHQALEFRYGGLATVRYGEAVAFERGGSPIEVQTRCDGIGRIELIVPGAFLDAASYPVVIDPAVGPTFRPSGAWGEDSAPDVAQHDGARNFAFVWQRGFASNRQIRARIYNEDGTPKTPIRAISYNGDCRNPSISGVHMPFSGSSAESDYVIVYEKDDGIFMTRLKSSNGFSAGGETAISYGPPGRRDRNPCISGDGSSDATIVFDRTPIGANVANQIVVVGIWHESGTVHVSPEMVLQTVGDGHVRRPRMARTATYDPTGMTLLLRHRVVWERFYSTPVPGDYDLQTAVVGTERGASAILSPPIFVPGNAVGSDEKNPDIAMVAAELWDPDPQYLIAWERNGDVKGHRYSLAGSVGSEIDIRSTPNFEGGPAVGAGACEFSVGYLETAQGGSFGVNVRAARVLLDGTVAIADKAIDVLNGPFQFGLRASSWPPATELSSDYKINSVMFAWTGQTGSIFGANDIRARRFDPVAANTYPVGSACPGPNGELPAIGTNGKPLPGNGDLEFTVTNAPANSLAVLLISDVLAWDPFPGAPGCDLYVGQPWVATLAVMTNSSGFGSVGVPIPCGATPGTTYGFQWLVQTPGHNSAGWISSDDLDVGWSQ